ncbi:MAG: hypothetical protein WC026_17340 [Hyphomicrobium sp.]|uniref:hypothetical protein n=1 Tax=Hyphomicrobium sp. TaxID=82 RepID=UPI00356473A2
MTDIKEAHEKAHEAVRLILESEFFRENFYNVRESDADAMAERLLKTTYASLEASGFVIAPIEANEDMNQLGMKAIADAMDEGYMLTPGEVFTKMIAARPRIEK